MEITVQQLIVWLSGAGCVIAASWILERIPKYVALGAQIKMWVFFGLSAVIGAGAYAIGAYVPVSVLQVIAPYFAIIAFVFSYVFLGTGFHQVDKKYTEAVVIEKEEAKEEEAKQNEISG